MANIRIFGALQLPTQSGSATPIYPQAWRSQQEVAIGGTSTQSEAMPRSGDGSYPAFVIIQADAACHVWFGADPTATTDHIPMAAGEKLDFKVEGGTKVAVIEA